MKKLLSSHNPRQLLYSVVVTNNGKNSPKWLQAISRTSQQRCFSVAQAQAAVNVEEQKVDWMKNLRGKDNEKFLGQRGDWWYTGKVPSAENLKKLSSHSTHVSCLPQVTLKGVTEEQMRTYFENSWLQTEILFGSLQGEEAFYRPPYHHLRHPLIFYYGHPATFLHK